MLGEPGLVEAQPLGELNLLEQFLEALGLRHPGSRLVVTESPKTYAPFLTQDLTVIQWMTFRQWLTPIRNYSAREILPNVGNSCHMVSKTANASIVFSDRG